MDLCILIFIFMCVLGNLAWVQLACCIQALVGSGLPSTLVKKRSFCECFLLLHILSLFKAELEFSFIQRKFTFDNCFLSGGSTHFSHEGFHRSSENLDCKPTGGLTYDFKFSKENFSPNPVCDHFRADESYSTFLHGEDNVLSTYAYRLCFLWLQPKPLLKSVLSFIFFSTTLCVMK